MMRKKLYSLVLLAAGLLIGTNAWADTMRIPQMKPMPQIVEEVFDDADALAAEDGLRHLPIKEACVTPAPRRIAQNLMEVTVHQVSTEAELTQAITDAVDGDEIKLTADITTTKLVWFKKAVTLNLGGFTLSNSTLDMMIKSNTNLTIKGNDDGAVPMGKITNSKAQSITIEGDAGSINLISGTIENTGSYPTVIQMYGATSFTMTEDASLVCSPVLASGYTHIWNSTSNASFTLYGNGLSIGGAACTIINNGSLYVYSGTFAANSITNNGTITFAGGTYDSSLKTLVEANLAEGKAIYGGKTTVSVADSDATIKVKNGEYNYTTISQAIADAAVGDELDLNCNQAYTGINITKSIILDLNGYILQTVTQNGSSGYMNIAANVSATIIDSKGTGQYQGRGSTAGFWLQNNATLTLDDADAGFTQKQYAGIIAYGTNSTVNIINNSVINLLGTGNYGLWSYQGGNINLTNSVVNAQYDAIGMYGGTLTCTGTDITCTSSGEPYGITVTKGASLVFNSGNLVSDDTDEEDAYSIGVAVLGDASSVTINGGTITSDAFAITGNGSGTTNSVITIKNGTTLTSTDSPCIYHPHPGTLNILGGTLTGTTSCIEIRAGELNISGGKFISTWKAKESESVGNGSGTTTVGAAIAVAQHTTLHPITVTITGGDFEGVIPVKLANPQNNSEEDINKVSVAINGGRYKVVNGAGAPFWSITENFAVSAGKFSHMPAYVVEGKTVVPNTDDDKDTYPWAIGEVKATPITPSGDITWQTGTDWPDNKVPTSQDKVTLTNGQNITVSGSSDEVAEAYGITIPAGATLTVESGATLVIGGGGITNEGGETNINGLKVEPGAQVIVSPDADMTGLYGRVALKPNVGKYPAGLVGEFVNKPNRYQLVGIPTKVQPAISKNKDDGDGFKLNQWDVETGWKAASLSDFSVPFKGFFFWNDVDLAMDATDDASRVTYYFKGELFGNKPQTLVFTEHEGFHLFANSYLAEVDIMALIQGAENNVQKAVYIYDPVQERFLDISYATYGKPGVPSAIQPMQGFYFLNQHNGTTTAPMDYVSMVWSNAFKVEQELVPTNAPRRNAAVEGSEVRINITDNIVGRTDGVYIIEDNQYSEDRDASDIVKMMNPATSVNIYATTELGDLSTIQTNDIENQYLTIQTNAAPTYTISFDWVAGNELYLLDTYTGVTTLMEEGNTYQFAAQPKSVIANRFKIVRNRAQIPTSLDNTNSIKAIKGIYTITGQRIGESVNWDNLPQGVYIVDGVKIVK